MGFDITTVGHCLMRADNTFMTTLLNDNHDPFKDVYENAGFRECIEEHANPSYRTTLFGTQADGTVKFYENILDDVIKTLTCTGGRPEGFPPIARPVALYELG